MLNRRCLALVACLLPLASSAHAQEIVALKKEVQRFGDPTENVADLIADIRDNLWKEVLLVPDPADKQHEIARLLAFSRGDLQAGATSGASGSTSSVISPLLPAIFGVAFENGAITRTVAELLRNGVTAIAATMISASAPNGGNPAAQADNWLASSSVAPVASSAPLTGMSAASITRIGHSIAV